MQEPNLDERRARFAHQRMPSRTQWLAIGASPMQELIQALNQDAYSSIAALVLHLGQEREWGAKPRISPAVSRKEATAGLMEGSSRFCHEKTFHECGVRVQHLYP